MPYKTCSVAQKGLWSGLQVAAAYEHADAGEYAELLAEATDPQLEDERLAQVAEQSPLVTEGQLH